ncbi:metallophosphoesterase family protein [Sphingoaurantiacus capsulatus]|uniref:Metallophosphoesterase family protein n=1 Tax=Sphingoaurantiacus capsulatus TaxID=1771310 RepID=A0ABV7XDV1_9SPHN
MKIAVLSDIHGNLLALDAVIADAEARGVDLMVNLGDICSGPLFPSETADRLIALDLPTIAGNHERQVLTLPPDRMGPSDRFTAEALRLDQRDWLASLPATLRLNDDVLLVHGTPDSDLIYFMETVTSDGLRAATPEEIESRAGGADAAVILCGHTHIPRVANLADGRLVVNPGSVGLPAYDDVHPYPHVVETGSPHARYAIVSDTDGGWAAELLTVDYDWGRAADVATANGRDDWARALRTGSV